VRTKSSAARILSAVRYQHTTWTALRFPDSTAFSPAVPGTETCTVVEMMASYEHSFATLGMVDLMDRVERWDHGAACLTLAVEMIAVGISAVEVIAVGISAVEINISRCQCYVFGIATPPTTQLHLSCRRTTTTG
jgi:hypothetical protein